MPNTSEERKGLVDQQLSTQTSVDSGSLTVLGAVIHRFREPGEYMGVVERGEETRSFRLTVDASSPEMQPDIDLAALSGGRTDSGDPGRETEQTGAADRVFVVHPEGHVVFRVSGGSGGYVVRAGKLETPDAALFDSTRLEEDDRFAVTLIRPGTYSVRNLVSGALGEIVVEQPTAEVELHRPTEPVEIECTGKALRPAKIRIQPGQDQIYLFRTPSRIAIELVEPDDGPSAEG